MRSSLLALAASREAASVIAADLAPLDRWAGRKVASAFAAMPLEIDPAPLIARLASRGMRIALPVVVARGEALIFREAVAAPLLVPDAAGIPAPPGSAAELIPDLVIAPLLAFDRAGGRLGQGGGYYDRTLAALRAAGPVTVIGLAFADQEVARAPMEALDQRLDGILTERGYIEVIP